MIYCQNIRFKKYGQYSIICVGQVVCDNIDERHKSILPARIWGDGNPEKVKERAAEEMKNTARAAAKFGVKLLMDFPVHQIWPYLYSFRQILLILVR